MPKQTEPKILIKFPVCGHCIYSPSQCLHDYIKQSRLKKQTRTVLKTISYSASRFNISSLAGNLNNKST